ncbi:rhodanese-like domain-containing protein [Baaleninema sp.]|uniref:rhodanese-like domain-containing protein n=1 Tax=Baaleninema sp. TaxID=3101197 RepID=UPI003CFD80B3
MVSSIKVETLAQRLATETKPLQLIDVREPDEVEIAAIDGFINLPMSQAHEWITEIEEQFDPTADTIVLCHHGIRSAYACHWLESRGFSQVFNVSGGIDAYAIVVDRSVPRY